MRHGVLPLALLAAACGHGHAAAPRGPAATPAPSAVTVASLADDVADLGRTVGGSTTWPQRVTFLGWTADARAAYRVLLCAPDPLGGRGDYCDLFVCAIAPTAAEPLGGASCDQPASFSLVDEEPFDAAAVTRAAEAATAALGPLAPGQPGSLDHAGVAIDAGALVHTDGAGTRRVVVPMPDWDPRLGVTGVNPAHVGTSPDGRCQTSLGLYSRVGEYEGVYGDLPDVYAVVTCAP